MASPRQLEEALRELDRIGTLVKDRPYRQVWRFEFDQRPYYLKFHPRPRSKLVHMARGNRAMREFLRLQWLQKASVPSPRAVAVLVGFRLRGEQGDALITEGIEPADSLDEYLNRHLLEAAAVPDRRALATQVLEIVQRLANAGLGHADLHLGNFMRRRDDGKLFLLDAYEVRRSGLSADDLLMLGHGAQRFAGTTDFVRIWRGVIGPGVPMPERNAVSDRQWRRTIARTFQPDGRYVERVTGGGWSGLCYRTTKMPRRWSRASGLAFTAEQWQAQWPRLLERIEADQLEVIKRTASGDVLAGEVAPGGVPLRVIVKRPRRKHLRRYVTDVIRGTRPRRAWGKAWALVARDVPTAWPLLLMERRTLGYVTDALIVFERIEGTVLPALDLETMASASRDALFRRLGRTLWQIERRGLSQHDAKASNWVIADDPRLGPVPHVVDLDGLGRCRGSAAPIRRLLRSLRNLPGYAPADSLAVCQGYAPRAPQICEVEEN